MHATLVSQAGAGRYAPAGNPRDKEASRLAAPQRFAIRSDTDIVAARSKGRELARALGFCALDATLVAAAISELTRNILTFAGSGEIVLEARHKTLVITARDEGPGIPDIEMAMRDGYSTCGGLGLGLPGTRRVMDYFQIVSRAGAGTTVTAKKFLAAGTRPMAMSAAAGGGGR